MVSLSLKFGWVHVYWCLKNYDFGEKCLWYACLDKDSVSHAKVIKEEQVLQLNVYDAKIGINV